MRRVVVFVSLGYLLIVLLGPLSHFLGMQFAQIDVALIIVLHVAMVDRRGGGSRSVSSMSLASHRLLDVGGVVTALLLGYLTDLLGAGLKGLQSFGLSAVFLVSRALAHQIYMAGTISQFLVTFVSSLVSSLFILGLRWIVGVTPGLAMISVILAQAALTAVFAPLLMRLLRFLDARLWQDSKESGVLRQPR